MTSLLDQTVQESCDTVEISMVMSGDYVMCAQVIMSCVHRACDVRLLIVLRGQPCILYNMYL